MICGENLFLDSGSCILDCAMQSVASTELWAALKNTWSNGRHQRLVGKMQCMLVKLQTIKNSADGDESKYFKVLNATFCA